MSDIKVGEDSLGIVSDMWWIENFEICLVCLLIGTRSKVSEKCQKSWPGGNGSALFVL